MPVRHTHLSPRSSHGQLAESLAALRVEFSVPDDFPRAALDEALEAPTPAPELDLRDIDFVTLDPAGSRDLDQAFHIERSGDGLLVRYAIADLPGFVRSGGALDLEARRRGQTIYLPDASVPLHPRLLSEGRASLLAGEDRAAYVWTVELDEAGAVENARVERALVRSRAQLDYVGAQRRLDDGEADGPLSLLPELGAARISQERARGGASLNLPDEEIVRTPEGYRIERRFPLPVEEWNAQLSLLVGIVAGESLPELPALMRASNQRTGQLTSAALERVEAALLRERIGEVLPAVVIDVRGENARVQLEDPPVTAQCGADGLVSGTRARVRVVAADIATGTVELSPVAAAG